MQEKNEKNSRFNKEKSDVEQLVGRIKKLYISKTHVTTIREQPYSRSLKFNIYLFMFFFLLTFFNCTLPLTNPLGVRKGANAEKFVVCS